MRDIHEILYSCLVYLLLLLEFQFVDGIDMALPDTIVQHIRNQCDDDEIEKDCPP